jgi:serine phosphatase RsbU (regulator of sigma subunit)
MPPPGRDMWSLSDSRRDAERYHRLLLALERATDEVKEMEDRGRPDMDEVLGRLLPDLTNALNARQGFVAAARETSLGNYLEVTAAHPAAELRGRRLPWRELFARLIEDSRPRVIDPLGEETPDLIPGLELFGATEAILVRAQGVTGSRVVGICNKRDAEAGPYLASDGRVLDNIIELVAIGARVGERHTQELQSVHRTSTAVSAEFELERLLPMISRQAAAVFRAPAASVMLWDDAEENLVVKASYGLPGGVDQPGIPKDAILAEVQRRGGYQPVFMPDLQPAPAAGAATGEPSALRAAVCAPLLTSGRLIGLLNIYCEDGQRDFTPDQADLTMIYANQVAIAVRNASLIDELEEKIDQLEAAQVELVIKERMEQELALARQVQQSVLPRTFPDIPGYRFAARNEPARQVGGDFYDVIPLDGDRFGLVIADVSDKGMPAALYMALTRSLILAEARRERSPAAVLANVNQILLELGGPGMSELGEPSMFVTAFYGVVDRATRRLTYARAGHDRPLLARVGSVQELSGQGALLGLFEGDLLQLSEEWIGLAAGDRLVLYTDGVVDSLSPAGEAFGEARLKAFLAAHGDQPPRELGDAVFAELTAFQGGAEQFDDMAVLVVEVM